MNKILLKLLNKEISVEEAEKMLKTMQIKELENFVKFDVARDLRTGIPEVILAEGKDNEEIIKIILNCLDKGRIMVTRLKNDNYDAIKEKLNFLKNKDFKIIYNRKAKILVIKNHEIEKKGRIGIITAGTSDIPVAEEARIVAEETGGEVITAYDVGVAGIHRLFSNLRKMIEDEVKILIVIAGMEGALPSVVAGIVDVPVVGVPTSVGYGVGKNGYAALLAMLQSCAPGIAVVNIDNGFGAGVFATTILNSIVKG
jgi:pyridinium-3,5-biscarboxylic acid mononucleotide synthase